ncbi:histidine kinase dimerization/phosphoacceptor domain -containing protein [Paracoccus sp. WLY502]|uniref:sensor histidine kinase n=1 Tax=Paracoccus yibinensis TaxID=3068891 RepID=UPI002796A12F|nr:histidine kinase dimerization/phosphoacceptor domain -containing protein [Paracoccus sp. WLY502]MDQ1902660.1 histidine kinase dimerization/phosphoacceptor domain -containing protein [Paracoccus sp. WLY502]
MRNDQASAPSEELAYRLRQQELTAEFGRYALRTHDTPSLLQEATRVCALGLQSDFCKVMRYVPDEGQFIVQAGVGWKPGVVGHARTGADTESPAGYTFQTGDPVISNHLAQETRFRTPALLVEHGITRAINVLISGDGGRYGVLEVDSPNPGRFTAADLAFLQGFANLLGVALERQQFEEALRDSEAKLQEAMAHQEVLTREISHRVKNSLAMVAGLLSMQRRMTCEPALQRALDDARTRVRTIAQIHDWLWRADEVHTINVAKFMGELCDLIRATAAPGQTLSTDIAPVMLATDQAVPLALLVNELVTNALKYAYPSGEGEVRLTIQPTTPGHLRLTICDRGQGLPPGFDANNATSLGMKLIASLGHQLDGQPEWQDADPGTRFVLEFLVQERSTQQV